eukprot:349878-Chlamydomonas_euryale.AAC.3
MSGGTSVRPMHRHTDMLAGQAQRQNIHTVYISQGSATASGCQEITAAKSPDDQLDRLHSCNINLRNRHQHHYLCTTAGTRVGPHGYINWQPSRTS